MLGGNRKRAKNLLHCLLRYHSTKSALWG